MHEHFEKRRRERGDSFSDLRIEEFSMAKIKRPYVINGVSLWLTGDSEQEIADKYAEIKNSSRPSEPGRKSKYNFEEFAKNNWQYISQTVSRNTNLDYKRYMKNQILPHFGKMNVEDITWRDVQDFYDKYLDKAFSTVHKWRIVLSRLLQIAVGDGIIPIDPTKDKRLTHSKKRTQRAVPCTEQYKKFLNDIERLEHPHERLYMAIVGYTGLRRGEVLALRWADIRFNESILLVERSVDIQRTTKKCPGTIKSPKSEAGIRTVPIVEPLRELLLIDWHSGTYVVTNPKTGKPIHVESEFNTLWKHIRQQINLGPYTSHSYRHAMATTLLISGVDIKTTQAIIGHSQPSTTLNIYSHALPGKIREAGLIFTEKMVI